VSLCVCTKRHILMNLIPDLIATFFLFIFMLVLLCFSPFLGE